jgi:hypothetical protein
MGKLEEVARAILARTAAMGIELDTANGTPEENACMLTRAAIEALMDPSEAMYVAYIENTENTGIVPAEGRAILAAAKSDWQAMLKAAMEEDK